MSNLVPNPWAALEEKLEGDIPTATLQIYQAVADYLAREESTYVNRASSANMCPRRRWYQKNGYKGTPLTPRKILNFAAGDMGEHVMKYFTLTGCVGAGKVYQKVDFGKEKGRFVIQGKEISIYEQEDLVADIEGIRVSAHADGFGQLWDGSWELIEYKTAADYGYASFVEDGPGDYLNQAHALMMTDKAKALGVKQVRFFYMKKSTGHIYDRVYRWDDGIAEQVIEGFRQANSETIPDKPYEPINETHRRMSTGRKILPWQCGYCPFTEICHPGVQKEFKGDKPVFVVPKTEKKAG